MNYLAACDRFFVDHPGGAERVSWELCLLMREQGHRVTLLCGTQEGDPAAGSDEVQGVRILRYREPRTSGISPFRMESRIRAATAVLRREAGRDRFDVIHTHMPASGLAALSAAHRDTLLVSTVHSPVVAEQRINWAGPGLKNALRRALGAGLLTWYERRLLRKAQRIHVLSSFTAQQLAIYHGPLVARPLHQIPWWQDPAQERTASKEQARAQLHWPSDRLVFFTLRRFVRRNGLETLVEAALPLLRSAKAMLVLGGDGPLRAALMARYASEIASGTLQVPGRLTDEQVGLAYQATDLFVLPTLSLECFGLIILEALGYGCPVVATRTGAIPEILTEIMPDGLCSAGDVTDLRDRLERFADGRLQCPPSEDLVSFVSQNYGRSRIAGRYLELLGSV